MLNSEMSRSAEVLLRRVFVGLVLVIAAFAVLHLVTRWAPLPGGRGLFNLDGDVSFPSWWSSVQLSAAAAALAAMAWLTRRTRDRWWRHWAAMSIIVLYLSMDEALVLHEQMTRPVRALLGVEGGALLFAWIVPAGLLATGVCLVLARFVLAQGASFARGVITAGVVYVGGAIGLEVLAGAMLALPQTPMVGVAIELEITLEESLEMLGVALLTRATLVQLLRRLQSGGRVRSAAAL